MTVIVLDPGHGGDRPQGKSTPFGNPVGHRAEKDVVLELGRLVQQRLGGAGSVRLTRTADRNISLSQRQALCRGAGGRVFVSLHAGGSGDRVLLHARANAASQRLAGALRLGHPQRAELAVLHPDGLPADTASCMVELDRSTPLEQAARTIGDGIRAYLGDHAYGEPEGWKVVPPDGPTTPVVVAGLPDRDAVRTWVGASLFDSLPSAIQDGLVAYLTKRFVREPISQALPTLFANSHFTGASAAAKGDLIRTLVSTPDHKVKGFFDEIGALAELFDQATYRSTVSAEPTLAFDFLTIAAVAKTPGIASWIRTGIFKNGKFLGDSGDQAAIAYLYYHPTEDAFNGILMQYGMGYKLGLKDKDSIYQKALKDFATAHGL